MQVRHAKARKAPFAPSTYLLPSSQLYLYVCITGTSECQSEVHSADGGRCQQRKMTAIEEYKFPLQGSDRAPKYVSAECPIYCHKTEACHTHSHLRITLLIAHAFSGTPVRVV